MKLAAATAMTSGNNSSSTPEGYIRKVIHIHTLLTTEPTNN